MYSLLRRVLTSQKTFYAMVPTLANVVAALTGVDPTTPLLLVLDAAFALLLLVQFVLDLRWGSPSDGTGAFMRTLPLILAGVLLSGCAWDVALYKDEHRTVAPVSVDAFGSFCFAGLEVGNIIILPAFGWGDLSCSDVISPAVTDGDEEEEDFSGEDPNQPQP